MNYPRKYIFYLGRDPELTYVHPSTGSCVRCAASYYLVQHCQECCLPALWRSPNRNNTLKQEQPRIRAVRNIFIPVKSAPRLNDTHRENMQRYLPTPPRSHISRVGVSRLLDNATDLIFEGAQRSIRGLDVCRSRQAA